MNSQGQKIYTSQTIAPSLPLNHKEGESFFADGLQYPTRQVCLSRHSFCFVLPTGEWYHRFSFVKDSAVGLVFAPEFTRKYLIKSLKAKKLRLLPKNRYLLFFDSWTSNHYHFHCDYLPRLMLVPDALRKESILLLPQTNYIENAGLKILNLLGLQFKSITLLSSESVYLILSELIYVSKSHTSGYIHANLMQGLRKKLSGQKSIAQSGFSKRLYIIRGERYGRSVLNEAAVIQALQFNFGFETVDFDQLGILEAIKLMQQTEIIVGMHGAALTNMIYMPSHAHVVEFRYNGKHNNHCYWHLASSCNLHYSVVFGDSDDETKILEGQGCNLTIPIDNLLATTKHCLDLLGTGN